MKRLSHDEVVCVFIYLAGVLAMAGLVFRLSAAVLGIGFVVVVIITMAVAWMGG